MKLIEEIKFIEGYNNKYCITNTGKVFANDFHGKGIVQEMKPRIIAGYLSVGLRKMEKGKSVQKIHKIHRLVAEHFIPRENNSLVVNHKDGNKLNNLVTNLEWVTIQENTRHAYRTGLSKSWWTKELGIVAINLIENYNYNFADVQHLFKLKQRSEVFHFYKLGYKTFELKVKNKNVPKHSKPLPLPEEYKLYIENLIKANTVLS